MKRGLSANDNFSANIPKTVSINFVGDLAGYSPNTIRRYAAQGVIPGAFQMDEGFAWKFDRTTVVKWWEKKRRLEQWHPSIKGARSIGAKSKEKAIPTQKPWERLLKERLTRG